MRTTVYWVLRWGVFLGELPYKALRSGIGGFQGSKWNIVRFLVFKTRNRD